MSGGVIGPEALQRLKAAAGPGGFLEGAETAPFCTPFRDGEIGATPLVLRPDSTKRVAALVAICAETGAALVPQGGNTGLTGAGLPHATGAEVVLSLGRMNRIRAIDPLKRHDHR